MTETTHRDQICALAKSMYDRGLTAGASGNISVRLDDGSLLVTRTGACFGRLDPARLSHLDAGGGCSQGMPRPRKCRFMRRFMNPGPHRGGGASAFLSFGGAFDAGRA